MSETNKIDALSILWNAEIFGIQYLGKYRISYLLKSLFYKLKGSAFIVYSKAFNVLTKDNLRFVVVADTNYIKDLW